MCIRFGPPMTHIEGRASHSRCQLSATGAIQYMDCGDQRGADDRSQSATHLSGTGLAEREVLNVCALPRRTESIDRTQLAKTVLALRRARRKRDARKTREYANG